MEKIKLRDLKTGEKAYIKNIEDSCNNKARLLDLGFTANTEITPVWEGVDKSIIAYLVKGTLIALRVEDAGYINIF